MAMLSEELELTASFGIDFYHPDTEDASIQRGVIRFTDGKGLSFELGLTARQESVILHAIRKHREKEASHV